MYPGIVKGRVLSGLDWLSLNLARHNDIDNVIIRHKITALSAAIKPFRCGVTVILANSIIGKCDV